ncbi:MAG: hypothetical protein JSW70_01660 [Syntrophobacterales bacterium]|nr:MAG: hypothetical protein JSW70_01660 [Syntrophobacterales bacterium]
MKGYKGRLSMVITLTVVSLILAFGSPCFSQHPREGGFWGSDSPAFEGDEPHKSIEKREKIRKRIELIRMWKLTEELDLTEETGAKLFPILHKYDEKWMELHKKRRDIMSQLRKALEDEATSGETIEAAMDNLEQNASAVSDLIRQQRKELKGILSPRQQAKFILFQRQFHREIRKIIGEARERKVRARGEERKAWKRRHDRPETD